MIDALNGLAARAAYLARLSVAVLVSLAVRGSRFAECWLVDTKKARYGLAVVRIAIGFSVSFLAVTNWRARFYLYGNASAWTGEYQDPFGFYKDVPLLHAFRSAQHDDFLFTVLYVALIVVGVLVMLGWRTKFVLPVLLIGVMSLGDQNLALRDQSDNALRIGLIVLLFADTSSRWSLDARRRMRTPSSRKRFVRQSQRLEPYGTILSNLAVVALALQLGFIYQSGALFKAGGAAWQQGVALYEVLGVAIYRPWPEVNDLLSRHTTLVVALSWGTVVVQMMFLPLLLNRVTRVAALLTMLSFHIGIGVFMGLPRFSLVMIALDMVFVRDATWKSLGRRMQSLTRSRDTLDSETTADMIRARLAKPAPTRVPVLSPPSATTELADSHAEAPSHELVPSGADPAPRR